MDKIDAILLSSLRVFLGVAHHKSFTKAASHLFLTVSAVSQTIKKLEGHLGYALFSRNANQVQLTDAGQILFCHGQQAWLTIEEGLRKIECQENRLRIFSPPGVSSFLFSQELLGTLSQYVTSIEMVADERPLEKNLHEWDLAILLDASLQPNENMTYLGDDVYFPFCHPTVAAKISHVTDILNFPLFHNQYGLASWDEWLALNQISSLQARKVFYSRASQLISAVEAGEGIGFESLRVLSGKLKRGDFTLCPLPHLKPIIKQAMWLYLNPNSQIFNFFPDIREKIIEDVAVKYDFVNISF